MYEIIIGGVLITIILIVIIYMMVNVPSYPAGLTEGSIIKCETTGRIYKLEGGKKRWLGLPPWKAVACNVVDSIRDGAAM